LNRLIVTLLLTPLLLKPQARAADLVTLDAVLSMAKAKSETVKALDQANEATKADIRSRDLALAPVLTSDLAIFNDNRQSLSSSSAQRGTSGLLNVSLVKPFSTGTSLTVSADHQYLTSDAFSDGTRNVADWEVRLSQSLWRDSFGRATRLRHESEKAELNSKLLDSLREMQTLLSQIEEAYWSLVLAEKEVSIREANLDRATTLEKWMRARMGRFAAEPTDLYQVQALKSQRQLDLSDAKNTLEAARSRIRQLIPGAQPETWQLDLPSLEKDRDPRSLLAKSDSSNGTTPIRLDALVSRENSAQARAEAERTNDRLKPSLNAYMAYGANGIDPQARTSWSEAAGGGSTEARLGLLLSVELDPGLKAESRNAARALARSREYREAALMNESTNAWAELERNLTTLRSEAREAQALAELQEKKVRAERVRYEQGRSTALQLTTFENDASDSLLRFFRLLASVRKAENTARQYAQPQSSNKEGGRS
jgi:outer membrane protein TolC